MKRKELAVDRMSTGDREAALALAMKGDEPSMSVVREVLDADPHLADKMVGILLDAERRLIAATYGSDLVARETIPRKLEALRKELGGSSPTPLEKLLVARIVTCWLQVQHADLVYSRNIQSEFAQKRLDRVHGRYLSAIKTLAEVRHLRVAVG
jgi:hypothetical protein